MHIHKERNELTWTNDCCCSFVVPARFVCGWMRLRKRYTESIKSLCVARGDVICNLLLIYVRSLRFMCIYVIKRSPTQSGLLAAGWLIRITHASYTNMKIKVIRDVKHFQQSQDVYFSQLNVTAIFYYL